MTSARSAHSACSLARGRQAAACQVAIKRTRALEACAGGGQALAVNGRPNRRVACVLDAEGLAVEILDLEEVDEEEEEEEEEAEEEGEAEGVAMEGVESE